jgi:hypothetical protein
LKIAMGALPKIVACVLALSLAGCNQHANLLDTPVSPTPPSPPLGPVATAPDAQPTLSGVTFVARGLDGGDATNATVELTAVARNPGVKVSLSSNDDTAMVPAEVVVPPGNSSARFLVQTRRVPDDRSVVISASTPNSTTAARLEVRNGDAPIYFQYDSNEADPIGGGGFGRLLPGLSTFVAVRDGNAVQIQITTPGQPSWTATFKASGDAPLEETVYGSGPDVEDGGATLDVRSSNRSCETVNGIFEIEKLDLRNDRLNLFQATFTQACKNARGGMSGKVRVEGQR